MDTGTWHLSATGFSIHNYQTRQIQAKHKLHPINTTPLIVTRGSAWSWKSYGERNIQGSSWFLGVLLDTRRLNSNFSSSCRWRPIYSSEMISIVTTSMDRCLVMCPSSQESFKSMIGIDPSSGVVNFSISTVQRVLVSKRFLCNPHIKYISFSWSSAKPSPTKLKIWCCFKLCIE